MKKCLLFACLAGTIALTFVPLDAHAGRGEDETGPSQPATAATKPTPEALLADLETQETLCLQTIKETQSQLRHDAQAMNNDYDAWLYAPPKKADVNSANNGSICITHTGNKRSRLCKRRNKNDKTWV